MNNNFNGVMRDLFGNLAVDVVTSIFKNVTKAEDINGSDANTDDTEDLGYAVIVEDDNLSC